MKIQSLSTHPDANEVWVKFFSPHKTAGVLKEKGIAIISQAIVMNSDQFSNVKKIIVIICNKTLKCFHTAPPKQSNCPG